MPPMVTYSPPTLPAVALVHRHIWLMILAVLAVALAAAPAAEALPANPWTGQWRVPVADIPCAGAGEEIHILCRARRQALRQQGPSPSQ